MQVEKAKYHYENLSLSSACESILEIGNVGNLYMDKNAPWSRFKQGGASSEMAAKVYLSLKQTYSLLKDSILLQLTLFRHCPIYIHGFYNPICEICGKSESKFIAVKNFLPKTLIVYRKINDLASLCFCYH